MPVRQVYPLAPYSLRPFLAPCADRLPIPPLPRSVLSTVDFACYVSGRTTSTLPLHLYCQPSIPSFHLSRRRHRRLLSVTSRTALLCALLNSYRRNRRMHIRLFIYLHVHARIRNSVSIANDQRHRYVLHLPLIPTLHFSSLSLTLGCLLLCSPLFSLSSSLRPTVPPLVADLINAKEFLLNIKELRGRVRILSLTSGALIQK